MKKEKSVAKKIKKRKLTGTDFKRLRRQAEGIYFVRYNIAGEAGPLGVHHRLAVRCEMIDAATFQLSHHPCFWQCVTISYFEDPFGKRYRSWGFAKTNDPLKSYYEPLDPVLKVAQEYAEGNANLKHLYARGYILAPWSKQYPDLLPLVKKPAKTIHLTTEALQGIEGYLNEKVELYEFDAEENRYPDEELSLDERIAHQLRTLGN